MFASPTLVQHLLRGAAAAAALAFAAVLLGTGTWLGAAGAAAAGAGALVLFRGCPMCWTMGLIETVLASRARKGRRQGATDAGPSANAR